MKGDNENNFSVILKGDNENNFSVILKGDNENNFSVILKGDNENNFSVILKGDNENNFSAIKEIISWSHHVVPSAKSSSARNVKGNFTKIALADRKNKKVYYL